MKEKILKKLAYNWSKGGITIRKLVLIVVGIGTMAAVMMTIQSGIEEAYTEGLENALRDK